MPSNLTNQLIKNGFLLLPPRRSHRLMEQSLAYLDSHPRCLGLANRLGLARQLSPPIQVGRLSLPGPLMLAAGLVKGTGFASETEALQAVSQGRNIMPGWRAVPAIAGPVEFGSFTPQPRMGNREPTLWRDRRNTTLYNRVGLRNPGIAAATAFLANHADQLPHCWGVSLAPDPEEANQQQRLDSLAKAARTLADAGVLPAWVTVNLSCPNAEPEAGQWLPDTQSPDEARQLCLAVREALPAEVAVWAKVGPGHSLSLYGELAHALAQAGVEAVVATNTLTAAPPARKSSQSPASAGMSATGLRPYALEAVKTLAEAAQQLPLEVIACGGVMDGQTWRDFQAAGAVAAQYWAALVFRGPCAADLILAEAKLK